MLNTIIIFIIQYIFFIARQPLIDVLIISAAVTALIIGTLISGWRIYGLATRDYTQENKITP